MPKGCGEPLSGNSLVLILQIGEKDQKKTRTFTISSKDHKRGQHYKEILILLIILI